MQSDVKIKQDTQNDKKKNGNLEEVMSVWDYLWIFMLASIPVIGTIIVIVKAFGSSNKNKTNYCRAIILGQVLLVLIVIMFWSSLVGILNSLAY